MSADEYSTAMTNRSLRNIKTELEFLADASILTSEQLSSLLDQLPSPAPLNGAGTTAAPRSSVPVSQVANLSVNARQSNGYSPSPSPAIQPQQQQQQQPPPAYPVAPAPPSTSTLTYATALFAYTPTDTGDLALCPQDRIAVTEYMNAEWWKGRSERTGAEGIFPRAYVRVEEKLPGPAPPVRSTSNYGNVPLDVSRSGGSASNGQPSKGSEQGKKFGKKLGNAAVFGAGATIGGNLVNAIF